MNSERKIIAKLISHLLSHDSYGYQNLNRVKEDLIKSGWTPYEAQLATKYSCTKECFRPKGWEKEFE